MGAFKSLEVRPTACGDNPRDRSGEDTSTRKGLEMREQERNPQPRQWSLAHLDLLLP